MGKERRRNNKRNSCRDKLITQLPVITENPVSEINRIGTKSTIILHLTALFVYLCIAFIYFGLPVIKNFDTRFIGVGADPTQYMWSFKWIIYVITHGVNPLYTNLIWVPGGYDLSFNTFTPGASLLSIPLTIWLGIVRTFNIWQIINPAIASYLTFIICYYLTKKYVCSLVGGYIFGFSSFEISQTLGHLQNSTIFLIPLMIYLTMLLIDNKIRTRAFIPLFSLSLIFQFLFSLEVFATFTILGVCVLALSYLCVPETNKASMRKSVFPIVLSYMACLLVVSPYLYHALHNIPKGAVHDPYYWVDDPLNFIIPTPLTIFGKYFTSISSKFPGNYSETDAYFGLGLLVIMVLFVKNNWQKPHGKVLFLAVIIPALASLGPVIRILGLPSLPSPFIFMAHLPLLKDALSNRMIVYSSLPMAIIVSMWLASSRVTWARTGLIVCSLLLIIPSLPYASSSIGIPPFISTTEYKEYIPKGSNVLIIPYGSGGTSMAWQAETNFYFTMAEGYLGTPPVAYSSQPVVQSFFSGDPSPNINEAVKQFVVSHSIRDIIVDADLPSKYLHVFDSLGVSPKLIGGVWLYQISDQVMNELKAEHFSLEDVNYIVPYDQAMQAVELFLKHEIALSNLYPKYMEESGILSMDFGYQPGEASNWTSNGEWIGKWDDNKVGVGIVGDYQSIKPIINKYRGIATDIYFPYPKLYTSGSSGAGQLLMIFDPETLLKNTYNSK